MSLYISRHNNLLNVMFGASVMRTIMLCIQTTVKSPVSVQVWGAISINCLSFLRKFNGNMDSAKYQSNIIHHIEMACECVVFSQKGYIFVHCLAPCHNTKINRTFIESNGIPILEWPDINPIENISNIMLKEIGNQTHVKKKICGSEYVKCGKV